MKKDKRMDQAVRWFILHRDEHNGSEQPCSSWRRWWQRRAFRQWCRSKHNVAAYEDVVRVHGFLVRWDHAESLRDRVPSNVVPLFEHDRERTLAQPLSPCAEPAAPAMMSRRKWAAAVAGIAVAGIAGAALKKVMGRRYEDVVATGLVLQIALRDGLMLVARNSDYRLYPSDSAHTVHLLNGQAAFNLWQSVPSPTRVTAPLGDVLAAAAEYAVVALDSLLIVTVLQGSVRVISSLLNAPEVKVSAGHKLILRRGSVPTASIVRVDAKRELAWMHGDLYFDGESFGEVASTFNLFNELQIVVSPSLARLTVPGLQCALSEPELFVNRFARDLDLEVRRDGKLIRVLERATRPGAR